MRTFLVILLALLLVLALKFGTIAPCGILLAEVRQQASREGGIALILAALPDSVLGAMIAAQFGPLTPGRCIVLALNGAPVRPPPQAAPQGPRPAEPSGQPYVAPRQYFQALRQAGAEAHAAEEDCRAKRESGALPSFTASADCSNLRILEAYRKAGYRYMDLIYQMTSKRSQVAEEIDQGKLTEAQGNLAMSQFFTVLVDEERARDRGQK